MEIACVTISHKKASIEELQKVWFENYEDLLNSILADSRICECAILMTCNRVELYVVGSNTKSFAEDFIKNLGVDSSIVDVYFDDECLEHLLRVSAGLESMIVGEDQILGQLKDFYHLSKKCGTIKEILDVVFSKAIQVGKKVRNLTNINKGSVSIGSAAVELAENKLGSLKKKKVLLIGAGEMGSLVAKAIANKDVDAILIANRTFSKAKELAEQLGGIAVKFDRLEEFMLQCDVVISATSAPHYIITKDLIKKVVKQRKEPILLIDIALPRDIEDVEVEKASIHTIDDLREISDKNLRKRYDEAKKAEKIIKEELEHLKQMLKDLRANTAISSMYMIAELVKRDEIIELYNKLKSKYGVDEGVIPILEDFANSFIKKFLRQPTVRLRIAARDGKPYVIDAVEYLFGGECDVSDISANKNEEVEETKSEVFDTRN
ncbi:glutamyl-tRNA reductase [Archaeoglobales archaeon]|nr:MAG: glutamyl-tRNA reductase [Archaeoglobales archaeon]